MTFIPAENGPDNDDRKRPETRDGEAPTEAITTNPGREDAISASADPSATRPMPFVPGRERTTRYDLSPDPATAAIDTAPWEGETISAQRSEQPQQAPQPAPGPQTAPYNSGYAAQPAPTQPPAGNYVPPQQPTGNYAPAQQPGMRHPGEQYAQQQYPGGGQYTPAPQQAGLGHPQQPGFPQYPQQYSGTPHTAAAQRPARDITPGIFMGQLVRAAVVLALAVAIAYYALRTVAGQWADELALQEGAQAMGQIPSTLTPWIDLIPVVACVLWGVVALISAVSTNRWIPLLIGLASGFAAIVSVQLLKRVFLEKALLGIQESPMNSLPSGHTAAAATAAMIAVMVAPASWRGTVAFFGALTTSLAGIATVLNGWHRPMDVMVAVLVVAFWAILGALVQRCLTRAEMWSSNLSVGTLVLAILFLAAAGLGLATMQTFTVSGLALATGSAAIVGTSLLGAHQTVRTLRPRRRVG